MRLGGEEGEIGSREKARDGGGRSLDGGVQECHDGLNRRDPRRAFPGRDVRRNPVPGKDLLHERDVAVRPEERHEDAREIRDFSVQSALLDDPGDGRDFGLRTRNGRERDRVRENDPPGQGRALLGRRPVKHERVERGLGGCVFRGFRPAQLPGEAAGRGVSAAGRNERDVGRHRHALGQAVEDVPLPGAHVLEPPGRDLPDVVEKGRGIVFRPGEPFQCPVAETRLVPNVQPVQEADVAVENGVQGLGRFPDQPEMIADCVDPRRQRKRRVVVPDLPEELKNVRDEAGGKAPVRSAERLRGREIAHLVEETSKKDSLLQFLHDGDLLRPEDLPDELAEGPRRRRQERRGLALRGSRDVNGDPPADESARPRGGHENDPVVEPERPPAAGGLSHPRGNKAV